MPFDAGAIRASNPLSKVVGQYVKLTRRGEEYLGCCPFHGERTASFTVADDKGFYHCFGCGAHGDVIGFLMNHLGVDFQEACQILGGERQAPEAPRYSAPPEDARTIYDDLRSADAPSLPIPGEPLRLWNPKSGRWTTYVPSLVHNYGAGRVVVRIDKREGGKETPPIRYAASVGPQGDPGWARWPFDKPRPLYGLGTLPDDPSLQILVVEGEKTADAVRRLLPDWCVITWPGGTQGARHASWSPLAGRQLVLVPDADRKICKAPTGPVPLMVMLPYLDQPGPAVMEEIAAITAALGCQVKVIDVGIDENRPDGWDLADAEADGWDGDKVLDWMRQRARRWVPVSDETPDVAPAITETADPIQAAAPPVAQYDGPPDDTEVSTDRSEEFQILGYDHDTYFYLPKSKQQVVELKATGHSESALFQLAPLEYWENVYPVRKNSRSKFAQTEAVNALIAHAHRVGVFDDNRIRGRGAWLDNGRVVVHTGPLAYVNGTPTRPAAVKSRFIYEIATEIASRHNVAATTKEANRLVQVCSRLTWESALSGALLAGWCVVAPICGAMPWRPHIWVTGPSQAGKSTVNRDIIGGVVGPFAVYADGKTTEPGVRQLLGRDARPVIMDECETEDKWSAQRMQAILDLARVSSSGGMIAKGTTSGSAITYTARASFCFSSINTAISHNADESRVTKLVLRRNEAADADEHYRQLTSDIHEWLTPEFAGKMLARSIDNLSILLKNCTTFTTAAARLLHNRRAADQIGPMLAGLFLCYSTKLVTVDDAEAWILKHDWIEHTTINATSDELRLLEFIATRSVKLIDGVGETTIGQAIMDIATGETNWKTREKTLGAYGIKVEAYKDSFLIVNRSSKLRDLLNGSPWAGDWRRPLRMIGGAVSETNTYFAPGLSDRSTRLPLSLMKEVEIKE